MRRTPRAGAQPQHRSRFRRRSRGPPCRAQADSRRSGARPRRFVSFAQCHAPAPAVVAVFALAAIAVWFAGVRLSDTTDVLATRLELGEALGGLILLAIATNLPEIAITVSAALANNLGVAIGNILGGIAIQTVVLAVLDAFGLGRDDRSRSAPRRSSLVLEAMVVIAVLVIAVMGRSSRRPERPARARRRSSSSRRGSPACGWSAGRARPAVAPAGNPPDGQEKPRGHARKKRARRTQRGIGTGRPPRCSPAGRS